MYNTVSNEMVVMVKREKKIAGILLALSECDDDFGTRNTCLFVYTPMECKVRQKQGRSEYALCGVCALYKVI